MEKEQSSKSGAWENWTATCKRMTLEHYIIQICIHICIHIHIHIYICIIYVYICICIHIQTVTPKALELNVRPEIIKFLIENKGSKLTDIGLR